MVLHNGVSSAGFLVVSGDFSSDSLVLELKWMVILFAIIVVNESI